MQVYLKLGVPWGFPHLHFTKTNGEAAVLPSHREIQALPSMRLGMGGGPPKLCSAFRPVSSPETFVLPSIYLQG